MRSNKLKTLSILLLLLKERERECTREDIIANNRKLVADIQTNFSRIGNDLLMYLYEYLYNTFEWADRQHVTYNAKSNEFTVFTSYPLKDGLYSNYDYVKISLSKDPSIPIKKEEIHLEEEEDLQNYSVQRTVSLLLPEDIELVRLESEKISVYGNHVKRLVALGRTIPPQTVMYRNLSDLSLITVASTASPLQKATATFIQDPKEIERIKPYGEVSFGNIREVTEEYWKDCPVLQEDRDRPFYTEQFLEKIFDYRAEKHSKSNVIEFDKNKDDDFEADYNINPYTGLRKGTLDDSVIDFIDEFRKKSEAVGGEDQRFAYEFEEDPPQHKGGRK